jgi:surface protein
MHNVENMSGMFGACSSLTSLPGLSGWTTTSLKTCSSLFDNSLLINPDLHNWNIGNILSTSDSMNLLFNRCGITPKIYTETLIAWSQQEKIPSNINLNSDLFYLPNALNAINDLSNNYNWNFDSDTYGSSYIELHFANLITNITEIKLHIRLIANEGTDIIKMIYSDGVTQTTSYNYPNVPSYIPATTYQYTYDPNTGEQLPVIMTPHGPTVSVVIVGNFTGFGIFIIDDLEQFIMLGAKNLVSVTDWYNLTSLINAFYSCSNFVSAPSYLPAEVREMDGIFKGCTSLTNVEMLETWDVSNVETMETMFYGCTSLRSVKIHSWSIGQVTSLISMFAGCKSLRSVDLQGWSTEQLTNMREMFV